jgi:hypothetical protein
MRIILKIGEIKFEMIKVVEWIERIIQASRPYSASCPRRAGVAASGSA